MEPSPYSMENVPLFFTAVDEDDAEKRCLDVQVELEHDELGIQRSEEPVSKSMRNVCAGVPIPMLAAHSVSSSSSVRETEPVERLPRAAGTSLNSLISKSLGSEPVLACRLRSAF